MASGVVPDRDVVVASGRTRRPPDDEDPTRIVLGDRVKTGTLSIDMNAFAAELLGGNPLPSLAAIGTQFESQFWGRDNFGSALLSNALEFFVGP
jgi:hypothetical protein